MRFFLIAWLVRRRRHAAAQSTGGRIRGTVTDTSGAAVTGANLALINEATNVTRNAVSGNNGEYVFLEVPVGTYDMEVAQQGFKKYSRKGYRIDLNEVVSLDIPLQIGGSSRNRRSDRRCPGRGHYLHATWRGGKRTRRRRSCR